MPCGRRGTAFKRILRLSILSEALLRAEGLSAEELTKSVPFDGATCRVYLKDLLSD